MASESHSSINTKRPKVSESDIRTLLMSQYGFKVAKYQPLFSFIDQNIRILVEDVNENPHERGLFPNDYLVKITNLLDSKRSEILEAQIKLLIHLRDKGMPCQRCVKTIRGEWLSEIVTMDSDGNEAVHKVSVRTFLPGQTLSSIPMTPKFFYDVGVFVARLTLALETFHLPIFDDQSHAWSMHNFPMVATFTSFVEDMETRRTCEDVLKAFTETIVPMSSKLRRAQVHGDLNDGNLLVSLDATSKETLEITGLIDVGDTCTSYRISDFAICVAFMLTLKRRNLPRIDVQGHMLAGYTSVLNMDEEEKEALYVLISSRLVQSVVYCSYILTLDPEASDSHSTYLNDFVDRAVAGLKEIWETPRKAAQARWDEILSSYLSCRDK